jgi:adenosylmethionine-8-amino-7-oxononanoate aminotransferase
VAAFELTKESQYGAENGKKFALQALEKGMLLRPLGSTVYLLPPLAIGAELSEYYRSIADILNGHP